MIAVFYARGLVSKVRGRTFRRMMDTFLYVFLDDDDDDDVVMPYHITY